MSDEAPREWHGPKGNRDHEGRYEPRREGRDQSGRRTPTDPTLGMKIEKFAQAYESRDPRAAGTPDQPLTTAGGEGETGNRSGLDEHGRGKEPEDQASDFTEGMDRLPVIAQTGITESFASIMQTALAGPGKAVPASIETRQVVERLVEHLERGMLQSQNGVSGKVTLHLDRATYGISGIGLEVTRDTVSVVLVNVRSPDPESLAAAGQMLVRELQRHYPNRTIRIHAKKDEGDPETPAVDGDMPRHTLRRNEFLQDRNP